jgi:GINS complex subunit 4
MDFDFDFSSYGREEEAQPILSLQRAWVAERAAPDILPYESQLLETISTRLKEQVILWIKCDSTDLQIAWIEQELISEHDSKRTFRAVIVQTEVERVKFLIRSYLRARLHKVWPQPFVGWLQIDKYAQYLLSSEELLDALSPDERQYLQKYCPWNCPDIRHNALLISLYSAAFMNSFPAHLQAFNDSRNEEMIEKPDMDKAVFCKVIKTPVEGAVTFPKYATLQKEAHWYSGEEINLEEGNIYLVRYSAVTKFIKDGEVELIWYFKRYLRISSWII